jgi:small subunit ribosomal protein S17
MARTLRGMVVSDKMEKTVVVAVSSLKEHPVYRKKYKVTTKFSAHDEANALKQGDMVEIIETRPLSRTKRWQVVRKLEAKDLEVKT